MKNAAALSGHPPTAAPAVGVGSRSRRAGRAAGPEVGRRAAPQPASAASTDLSTRDRVTQLLLAQGATTAGQLGSALGLSPAAIRRHLDAMLADGDVLAREQTVRGSRGRGRPAKVFLLTDAARVRCGTHHYDNMATAALRWIARNGGPDAVEAFAADQVAALEARCRAAMEDAGDDPLARSEALAGALTAEGYAANASTIASGGQLCQHHCPVAHVAAEFPQLCEAETAVISRLVGTHVQRLATIAHGDGVCTTHIPTQPRAQSGNTVTTVRTDR
ncbi:helix-turn-helix transcriptional regulator [Micromonospora rifamycinica]|uniref:Predicted transcriptional regulator, ArsR family n=1 Tax=Micromonospora rifamycinica TaxID=291594 RepID=A0A1C5KEY2_9ACTN|nr:Predicted transcriptional regulator, ArsR family [Micromonospora rifamycinica]